MASMGRHRRSALAVIAVLFSLPLLALAATLPDSLDPSDGDLSIIVSQTPGYVEVFVRADARTLIAQLGASEDPFIGDEGKIDWHRLTTDTESITETLFPSVPVVLDGQIASMEPMSLMLHPRDAPQAFTDPVDAIDSIGPCGTEQTVEGRGLDGAVLHIGFIVDTGKTAPAKLVELPFIDSLNGAIGFHVRHFIGHEHAGDSLALTIDGLASIQAADL